MKKINQLLLVIFLLTPNVVSSQSEYVKYYRYLNKGEISEANGDYEKAYQMYILALKTAYPFPDDIIDAMKCRVKTNSKKDIPKLIRKLIQCGYKKGEIVYPFVLGENTTYYSEINKFPISEYEKYFDYVYTKGRARYLTRKRIVNSQVLNSFSVLEHFVILQRAQLPDRYDIQINAYKNIYYLLLNLEKSNLDISRQNTDSWLDREFITCLIHTAQYNYFNDSTMLKQFDSFLWKMVLKGNLHSKQYATIIDAVYAAKYGISRYGESLSLDENDNFMITKVADIRNIDSIRKKIFLSPLWVKCKLKNIKLPEGYKY